MATQPAGVPNLAASAAVKAARRFSSFGSITQALRRFDAHRGWRRVGTEGSVRDKDMPTKRPARFGKAWARNFDGVGVKLLIDQVEELPGTMSS